MRKFILLPCLFVSQALFAGDSVWTDLEASFQFRNASTTTGEYHTARRLKLDFNALSEFLSNEDHPLLDTPLLELPLADGSQMLFRFERSQVMAPALAARYPEIKTWRIYNPENPTITGRIDLNPNGFHAVINTADGDRIFIDPQNIDGGELYTSLSHRANQSSMTKDFQCSVHGSSPLLANHPFASKPELDNADTPESRVISKPADDLITYRLAVAATGEYTQLFGGSKFNAMAAIVTTVNRLNQVYERDLSIHLQLVENNDSIIYTSPSTDPYTNEYASAMVDENIVNINSVIGVDNFDIGHVFGTGNTGGLAFLNSACGTYKAGGVTGSNTPSGDAFNIDYVAHEIGHQLGASHTFNGQQLNCSPGNRAGSTAVEPGSGSSIMAYAGICGTDNLQSHSDAFFHSASINQIFNYTRLAGGSSCGTAYNVDNDKPTVDAGENFIIPAQTPFYLKGSATDADGDTLLYSWEQIDTGASGGLYTDLGNNPLFRVWPPTAEPVRYFPVLSDAIHGTTSIGETLPTTSRSMNFNLLVRDNNGGVGEDSMTVDVINTGLPFAVTKPNGDTFLAPGQSLSVEWDVAGTNESPINCSAVSIKLIEQSGALTTLLRATANDGAETISIPANTVSIDNSRIKVGCNNNIFYALSQGDIKIIGGDPVLTLNSPSIIEEDSGTHNLSFIATLSANAPENVTLNYEITDQATGAILKRSQTVINEGSRSVSIQLAVAGDTLFEANQVIVLTLDKPSNAQFTNGGPTLTTTGLIIDDDTVVAANPNTDTPTTVSPTSSSGGGGSISLMPLLSLVLLMIGRYGLRMRA